MESKLSEVQSNEKKLSEAIKSIESQLGGYHEQIASAITNNLPSANSLDQSAHNLNATPPQIPTGISEESVVRLASSLAVEQREKEKRQLNIILHNLVKPTASEGANRKKEDIKKCCSLFQTYLGPQVSITNAVRLGKRADKPRLLKLTLSSNQEKSLILKNKMKLRSSNNPEYIRKLFITPDLTPREHAETTQRITSTISRYESRRECLHDKKCQDSAEANMSSLCTDNYYPTPSSDLPSPAHSNYSNQSPQLSALVVNCQSLVAKKASFLNLLNARHPDIVFRCESWLNASISNSEIFPPNHTVYRQDRADGYGGVFLACRDNLITHEVTLTNTNCELIVCQVQFSNQCTLLACYIYRPPSSDELYLENLCQQLTNIRSRFPNSALWIGGDINLPDIKWCDGSIAGHSNSLGLNNLFLDFLDNNALSQMVDSPTRGSSILDVFITDSPGLLESCHVVDGISDYEVVLVTSSITADLPPPTRRTIYLWSLTDLNLIRETAQSLCQRFTTTHSTSTPIDILWNDFMSICNTLSMDLVPTKLSSAKHHQPWIHSHIKCLTCKKQHAYNHACSTNTEHDWAKYKDIKRQCQYECRNSFNLYVPNLIDPNSSAVSKCLW